MSAGFSPASLRRLRSWATGLMTDECRIVGRQAVTDPHTGRRPVPKRSGTRAGAKCRPAAASPQRTRRAASSRPWARSPPCGRSTCICPTGPRVSPGDVAEITAATDPNLKGRKFRLLNMQSEKTHATACRWNVKEVGNSNEQ